jgi:hypothetical protein
MFIFSDQLRSRTTNDRQRLRDDHCDTLGEAKRQRQEYFALHGHRLQREAAEMRQRAAAAQQLLAAGPGADGWPVTASHWQDVFASADELQFSGAQRAKLTRARQGRSARLTPSGLFQEEVKRLYPTPRCKAPYPTWLQKVSQSRSPIVTVRIPGLLDEAAVIWIARTRRCQPWALLLDRAPPGSGAHVHLRTRIPPASIRPVQDLWQLTEAEAAATEVYAASIDIRSDVARSCFLIRITGLDEIKSPAVKTAAAPTAKPSTDVVADTDSEDEALRAWKNIEANDSDSEHLVSSEDDEQGQAQVNMEDEQDEGPLSGEDEAGSLLTKAAKHTHTHTVDSNPYYTLTDNRNYSDCRLTFHQQWMSGPDFMAKPGKRFASKTLSPAVHGELRHDPVCTHVVLRSWAIWRMRQSPAWLHAKSVRQMFVDNEVGDVKRTLATMDHPLHVKVVERLRAWAPEVLE